MTPATIAEGIGFTEGPLLVASGDVLVTSMSRGLLYRCPLDGGPPQVAAETGGGPNGLARGPDGAIYVAQNGNATMQSRSQRPVSPGIQRLRDGTVEDLVTTGCLAPNDLVVGPDGLIWFTDPGAESPCVRTLDPESGELLRRLDGIGFPNGIAFADDGERLFVVDSAADAIVRFELRGGAWSGPTLHAHVGGGPDGIAFDRDGQLFVAAFEADEVAVLAPDGTLAATIPTGPGSRPTNLCFAGDDLDTLVVTAARGGRVLALAGGVRGRDAAPWVG